MWSELSSKKKKIQFYPIKNENVQEKERKGKKKTKLIVLSCTQDLQTSLNKTQEIEKQENQKF